MKKKPTKHYVTKKTLTFDNTLNGGNGHAACGIYAIKSWGEVTNRRDKVTCKNCKKTKLFRGVK